MKIKVFRDWAISLDGIEPLWIWECPDKHCQILRNKVGYALFWENAFRSAMNHIAWHKQVQRAQL